MPQAAQVHRRRSNGRRHDTARCSFYSSKEWRRLRAAKISANSLCEQCLKRGRMVKANTADHIQPIVDRPDLALRWENLQSLCHRCHSSKTASEVNRRG